METLFGSFGAKSLSNRRKVVHNIYGNPNSRRVNKLFFLNLYKVYNLYILMDFYHCPRSSRPYGHQRFFSGNKSRGGQTLIGVYLEGSAPTCYKSNFVARRKNAGGHSVKHPLVLSTTLFAARISESSFGKKTVSRGK
jgi:hypothetical protein